MTEQTFFEEDLKEYREFTKTIKYPFIICFITEEMLSSPLGKHFEIIDYKKIDNIEKIPRTILGISVISTLAFLCAYIVFLCNLFYTRFLMSYLKN